MAIEYKKVFDALNVPVLHSIEYNKGNFNEMYEWCKHNCIAPFYTSPSWHEIATVQFEDDQDALLFALTWGANK